MLLCHFRMNFRCYCLVLHKPSLFYCNTNHILAFILLYSCASGTVDQTLQKVQFVCIFYFEPDMRSALGRLDHMLSSIYAFLIFRSFCSFRSVVTQALQLIARAAKLCGSVTQRSVTFFWMSTHPKTRPPGIQLLSQSLYKKISRP